MDGWVDGCGRCPRMIVGMRVSSLRSATCVSLLEADDATCRIVEYATREQAQQAVAQLSNQNLMGRLVYVREVGGAEFRSGGYDVKVNFRIVRRNLDLSVLRAATVADMAAAAPAAT